MLIKKIIKFILPELILSLLRNLTNHLNNIKEIRELILSSYTHQMQHSNPNPLNSFGKKCFSQTDEDGITLEILRRINCISHGTFAEFGVGDGTENNTLILKSLGWKGFWVGGEDLAFKINITNNSFLFIKNWITLENIIDLTIRGITNISAKELDVISLDLDGNDIYFAEKLLSNGFLPKLFIVEYNSKFPPPVKWQIEYDATHSWQGDDYFGASLKSFSDLFNKFGYILVCCNSDTGSNAFYVKDVFSDQFKDIPLDIDKIYVPPRYHLYKYHGHKKSIRTIEKIFD